MCDVEAITVQVVTFNVLNSIYVLRKFQRKQHSYAYRNWIISSFTVLPLLGDNLIHTKLRENILDTTKI